MVMMAILPFAVMAQQEEDTENGVVSLAGRKGFTIQSKKGDFVFKPYLMVQTAGNFNWYDDEGLDKAYNQDNIANTGFAIPYAVLGFTGKAFDKVSFNLSINAAASGGRLIRELDAEIEDIEAAIQSMMDEIQSPITTIPGIGVRMGAMILAEIGDFSCFDSPDKILAYAGMSPSTYQSGQLSLSGSYSHMEKRGSRYLRYALYNATKYVCLWDPTFAAYLAKKRAEGKHYNVALSHAAKKFVRLIYAMERSQQPYNTAA